MRRLGLLKRLVAIALILAAIGLCVMWMCFQHIPAWHQPLWLSRAEADAVRDHSERTFEIVSQKMVAGDPFSITFTTRQINEILSAQQSVWPAATDWLNPQLGAPCIDIEPDHIKIGMRYHWGQIQSILNIRVMPQIRGEELNLHLGSVRAGSLPIPSKLLTSRILSIQPADQGQVDEAETQTAIGRLPQFVRRLLLKKGTASTANHFNWPNGDIPFQIAAISLDSESITLEIQPEIN